MFCPSCGGGPHAEAAKFCASCGRALSAPAAPPLPPPLPPPAPAPSRRRARLVTLLSVLTAFPGLPFCFGIVDAVREATLDRYCERGWPALGPDAPEASIRAMVFGDKTLEWGSSGSPGAIELDNTWQITLPSKPLARFDPSCGRSCAAALSIDGLYIAARLGSPYSGSTSGVWHLWRYSAEAGPQADAPNGTRCFLEMRDPLPTLNMVIDPLAGKQHAPRELGFAECPSDFRWLPSSD